MGARPLFSQKIRVVVHDVGEKLFSGSGFGPDLGVVDLHVVEILKNQRIPPRQGSGQDTGVEEAHSFEFLSETRCEGIGQVKLKMNDLGLFQADLPELCLDVFDDVFSVPVDLDDGQAQ